MSAFTDQLLVDLGEFSYDPHGWVYWAFPWGEGELRGSDGPNKWQANILKQVQKDLLNEDMPSLNAVASGHGVGKSALVAWLNLWAMSTAPGTRGVITANTENQLKTKTFVELAKWHRLFMARDLFDLNATNLMAKDPKYKTEWRIDIVPWSERNTEAFAGLHNAGKRIAITFDEASAIHDMIWETTEGALTDKDTEILWWAFGNPTKPTGRFRACFEGGKFNKLWRTTRVDSRDVPFTNKEQFTKWIDVYGADSDFVRVRVLGKFPKASADSWISFDLALEATADERKEVPAQGPVILGVDVARFGDDLSVIYPRQGRDARSRKIRVFSGIDTMALAGEISLAFQEEKASIAMIDGGGVGGGVVDRVRQLGIPCHEVSFGAKPDNFGGESGTKYFNKRAEIYGHLREWLSGSSIPDRLPGAERSLPEELAATPYVVTDKGEVQLKPKQLVKDEYGFSPDFADALACTFATPWIELTERQEANLPSTDVAKEWNPYDMFEQEFADGPY